MIELQRGGNAPLQGDRFEVSVRWKLSNAAIGELDVSAFVLNGNRKVSRDEDMIFYGKLVADDGSVRIQTTNRPVSGGQNEASFEFDLSKAGSAAEFIAITATIGDAVAKRLSFDGVATLQLLVTRNGATEVVFDVPVRGMSEAALIVAELYKRNGQWKIRAVGQGFNGGLKPLAESFGVYIEDAPAPTPAQPPQPTPAPANAVSLKKVSLTKDAPGISLAKKDDGYGEIKINLNWNKGSASGGFFNRGGGGIDLDLACLYELQDGTRSAVQALGNSFGSFDNAPFIKLMADDRTGELTDGEWMRINGARWKDIKRVLIFAYIYKGVANWAETDGVITTYVPNNAPIEVKLDGQGGGLPHCAVVMLENVGGGIKVTREVKYFAGHKKIDENYGWGLNWTPGRK